jgi:hypothetical protein
MQLFATGKWSKVDKRWHMIVALRRPASNPGDAAGPKPPAHRPQAARRFRKDSDR